MDNTATPVPRSRAQLNRHGVEDRRIYAAAGDSGLTRVRRGQYVHAEEWDGAYSEQREIALAFAAADEMRRERVFSHVTAAALHGLPLFRHRPGRTHMLVGADYRGGPTSALFRHRDAWDGASVERQGLRVTSLERTLFDVTRTTRIETALACADAALRMVAHEGGRGCDLHRAERLRADVAALVREAKGRRGVRQAADVMEFADPRAESPGESVSRLYLRQLGFTGVELQVAVRSPTGNEYFVDFDVAGVLGEYDGAQKYVDERMRAGLSLEAVLLKEKRREDWIRATTGRKLIRWTTADIATRDDFGRYLRSLGVVPRVESPPSRRASLQ